MVSRRQAHFQTMGRGPLTSSTVLGLVGAQPLDPPISRRCLPSAAGRAPPTERHPPGFCRRSRSPLSGVGYGGSVGVGSRRLGRHRRRRRSPRRPCPHRYLRRHSRWCRHLRWRAARWKWRRTFPAAAVFDGPHERRGMRRAVLAAATCLPDGPLASPASGSPRSLRYCPGRWMRQEAQDAARACGAGAGVVLGALRDRISGIRSHCPGRDRTREARRETAGSVGSDHPHSDGSAWHSGGSIRTSGCSR